MPKHPFTGTLISIQPRIRLTRSFDQRSHSYLGYALTVDGEINGTIGQFSLGIGQAAQAKHQFQVGDEVSGEAHPVADSRLETVNYYKVSKLKVLSRATAEPDSGPPWHGIPDDLDIYRQRGHRRLAKRTYEAKCGRCIWGCHMAVVMIIDQWNPSQKRYRSETFCHDPLSCPPLHNYQ